MDAKTMFMDAECPLDKWLPVKEYIIPELV
jgi:hypothetical protein